MKWAGVQHASQQCHPPLPFPPRPICWSSNHPTLTAFVRRSRNRRMTVAAGTAADQKKAEEVKGAGNELLLAKDYTGAERCYTKALELSPDGPNSHVYLCNRAAALSYLGRNEGAVVDCQEAIDLNPSYAKAYTRLGYAFFQVGRRVPHGEPCWWWWWCCFAPYCCADDL